MLVRAWKNLNQPANDNKTAAMLKPLQLGSLPGTITCPHIPVGQNKRRLVQIITQEANKQAAKSQWPSCTLREGVCAVCVCVCESGSAAEMSPAGVSVGV